MFVIAVKLRIMSKNTILKAIHNTLTMMVINFVLRIMSKNTILKAIHNIGRNWSILEIVENHE